MSLTGLYFLFVIISILLVVMIFRGPLGRFWARHTSEFRRQQDLQKVAATSEHGHVYLTIEKYNSEIDPIEEIEEPDGTKTYAWGGNEFSNEEAANHARFNAVLAAARAYYGDIDLWTKSLPPPPRPRRRRRR